MKLLHRSGVSSAPCTRDTCCSCIDHLLLLHWMINPATCDYRVLSHLNVAGFHLDSPAMMAMIQKVHPVGDLTLLGRVGFKRDLLLRLIMAAVPNVGCMSAQYAGLLKTVSMYRQMPLVWVTRSQCLIVLHCHAGKPLSMGLCYACAVLCLCCAMLCCAV